MDNSLWNFDNFLLTRGSGNTFQESCALTAAPHGGLSADGSAQKPVLYAAIQPEIQGYRYFLKEAVVTVTAIPSRIAAGNNSRLGYTAVGQDRYSMQGIYTAGFTIRLAWW